MLCCTVLYCTVLSCTVLYCTVLYCTVRTREAPAYKALLSPGSEAYRWIVNNDVITKDVYGKRGEKQAQNSYNISCLILSLLRSRSNIACDATAAFIFMTLLLIVSAL